MQTAPNSLVHEATGLQIGCAPATDADRATPSNANKKHDESQKRTMSSPPVPYGDSSNLMMMAISGSVALRRDHRGDGRRAVGLAARRHKSAIGEVSRNLAQRHRPALQIGAV
jgi:hypothetical protein